jgi:hypothetical protein
LERRPKRLGARSGEYTLLVGPSGAAEDLRAAGTFTVPE